MPPGQEIQVCPLQLQLELQEQRHPPHGEGALPQLQLQRLQRGTPADGPARQVLQGRGHDEADAGRPHVGPISSLSDYHLSHLASIVFFGGKFTSCILQY